MTTQSALEARFQVRLCNRWQARRSHDCEPGRVWYARPRRTVPILLGFEWFSVDLGGPWESLLHGWILLGALGAAVAIPSAPGFIGPYQLAFTAVLVPFGVAKATALAMGVVVWFIFWLTLTAQGLLYVVMGRSVLFEPAKRSQ